MDSRGRTSCCTDAPSCQSYGRTPQPPRIAGLMVVVLGLAFPKFKPTPPTAAHRSPPAARLSCASGLSRLQSTTKLRLPSVQPRAAAGPDPMRVTMRAAGLLEL